MLIIAHRLSTVRLCDRIITVEAGEVVEDGTHDELMGTGGRYARLWRNQLEGIGISLDNLPKPPTPQVQAAPPPPAMQQMKVINIRHHDKPQANEA